MADYNENNTARLKHLAALGTRVKSELDTTVKYVSVNGGTVSFFKTADGSGTAAFTFDFPEEIFLDQTGTTLVENFAWSLATYPNSTNPDLEGKTVLVLAVRGDKATNATVKYSFVDVSKLIDTYTAQNAAISVAGTSIGVQLSAAATNILSIANDGLLAEMKIAGASAGNIVTFDANGNLVDSGVTFASDADVNTMITSIFGAAS